MEDNPQEAVKNNTLGAYILAKTAAACNLELCGLPSVMGASKRLGGGAALAFRA